MTKAISLLLLDIRVSLLMAVVCVVCIGGGLILAKCGARGI